MHNLHFIRIKAAAPEDACNTVESHLFDWGNENNWRKIEGCISENNEVYINDTQPNFLVDYKTTDDIKRMLLREINSTYGKEAFEKCYSNDETLTPGDWLGAMSYCEHKYNCSQIDPAEFDIFSDVFYEYQYDHVGLTDITDEIIEDDIEDPIYYFVFVNMHS